MSAQLIVAAKGRWVREHRFLQGVTVSLLGGEGPLCTPTYDRGEGKWTFDIPDDLLGGEAILRVVVASPLPPDADEDAEELRDPPLCEISERLTLSESAPLIALAEGREGPRHPRLALKPSLSSGGSGVLGLSVDLLFLHVTHRCRVGDWASRIVGGCDVRLFQYTGQQDQSTGPAVWAVAIPFKAVELLLEEMGALLFFCPCRSPGGVDVVDTDIDDYDYDGQLHRYLSQRHRDHPYYFRNNTMGVGPDCDFGQQIVDANKQMVMVLPQNSGRGRHRVILSRLAVGGFSYGGAKALECWRRNRSSIDELYLMDPNKGQLDVQVGDGHLQTWAADHTLRLIGGELHEHMLAIKGVFGIEVSGEICNLQPPFPRQTLWPEDPRFWGASQLYRRVWQPFDRLSADVTSRETGTVSDETGVYLADEDPTLGGYGVRLRSAAAPDEIHDIEGIGEAGAAFMSKFLHLVRGDDADPDEIIPDVKDALAGLRFSVDRRELGKCPRLFVLVLVRKRVRRPARVASMIRLTIRCDNAEHFTLSEFTPRLRVAERELVPTDDTRGAWVFEIDSALAKLSLVVEIAAPEPPFEDDESYPRPLYRFEQRIVVSASELVFDGAEGEWEGPAHPRCVLSSFSAGDNTLAELELDLRFIDVTAYWDWMQSERLRLEPFEAHLFMATEEDYMVPVPAPELDGHAIDGCQVRLLQYTGPDGPPVWAAVIPAAASGLSGAAINSLLFFPPARGAPYSDICGYNRWQLDRYLYRAPRPETPYFVDRIEGIWWNQAYPRCRFASQLTNSGKPVVLVIPAASGSDFGAARGRGAKALIGSVLTALWSGEHIGTFIREGLEPGRFAVGGFSYGGQVAIDCWRRNKLEIDELYLFDPNPGKFNRYASAMASWSEGKKVRLIGGWYLRHLRGARSAFGIAPTDWSSGSFADATLWPDDGSFFERSEVYRSMYAPFDCLTPASSEVDTGLEDHPPHLRPIDYEPSDGTAIHPRVSAETGVYLDRDPTASEDGVYLRALLPSGDRVGPRRARGASSAEAAHAAATWTRLVGNRYIDDCHRRILDSSNDLRAICSYAKDLSNSRRHQWVVCGGQSPEDNPASMVGYLQLCLEASAM